MLDTWEATLSPAQNKQCLFCKPNSLRELPKLATRPHVPRGHIGPAPVGQGRPELPGTGDWEGDKRTDPALAVTGTRCSCTGTFLGKSPSAAHRGCSKSEAQKGRRQSSGGSGTSELLPRARARPLSSPRPLGFAVEISILAASRVCKRRQEAGREAGTIPPAAVMKGSGWNNPRAGSGGAAPSPGPGNDETR